jgi:hypothetical protein
MIQNRILNLSIVVYPTNLISHIHLKIKNKFKKKEDLNVTHKIIGISS